MRVQFIEKENGPERLLCDGEIIFDEDGPLAGMKLIGFAVWRGQEEGSVTVTFPARSYGAGGERRFFELLRAIDPSTKDVARVKDWIAAEWRQARAA
jgi:hypothetical protein